MVSISRDSIDAIGYTYALRRIDRTRAEVASVKLLAQKVHRADNVGAYTSTLMAAARTHRMR